jgi:flagellar protein FlaG
MPQPGARVERAERPERGGERGDSLRRAVDEINSSLAMHRRHLGIRFHEPTNRRVVTVYDSDTNDIIREIPPERVLEAHANMLELAGLFMNTLG